MQRCATRFCDTCGSTPPAIARRGHRDHLLLQALAQLHLRVEPLGRDAGEVGVDEDLDHELGKVRQDPFQPGSDHHLGRLFGTGDPCRAYMSSRAATRVKLCPSATARKVALPDAELAAIDALDSSNRGGPDTDRITPEAHGRAIPEA